MNMLKNHEESVESVQRTQEYICIREDHPLSPSRWMGRPDHRADNDFSQLSGLPGNPFCSPVSEQSVGVNNNERSGIFIGKRQVARVRLQCIDGVRKLYRVS